MSPYVSAAAAAKEIEAAEVTSGHVAASKKWSVREWQELQQPSLLLRRPLRAAARNKQQQHQQQQQPWEHLFLKDNISEDKGLQLSSFCQEIEALEFKWPTTINTGQAPTDVRIVPGKTVQLQHFSFLLKSLLILFFDDAALNTYSSYASPVVL